MTGRAAAASASEATTRVSGAGPGAARAVQTLPSASPAVVPGRPGAPSP